MGDPLADSWLGKSGGDGGGVVKDRGKDRKRRRKHIYIIHANTVFIVYYS